MSEKTVIQFGPEKERREKLAQRKQLDNFLSTYLFDGIQHRETEEGFTVWIDFDEDALPDTKKAAIELLYKLLIEDMPNQHNAVILPDEDSGGLIKIFV